MYLAVGYVLLNKPATFNVFMNVFLVFLKWVIVEFWNINLSVLLSIQMNPNIFRNNSMGDRKFSASPS